MERPGGKRLWIRGFTFDLVHRGRSGPARIAPSDFLVLDTRQRGPVDSTIHAVRHAGVAQMVEHLTCNEAVGGSSPFASSCGWRNAYDVHWRPTRAPMDVVLGEVPERSKGADCKSVGARLRRFESFPRHHLRFADGVESESRTSTRAGIAQLARASAFQAEGRGFESRFPLQMEESRERARPGPRSSVGRAIAW